MTKHKHPEGRRTNPKRESDPKQQPRTSGSAGTSPGNTLRGITRPAPRTDAGAREGPETPKSPPKDPEK